MFKRLATGLHTAKVSFVMRSTVSQKMEQFNFVKHEINEMLFKLF